MARRGDLGDAIVGSASLFQLWSPFRRAGRRARAPRITAARNLRMTCTGLELKTYTLLSICKAEIAAALQMSAAAFPAA